ncbi:MAG: hypothetical protein ABUS49_12730, partial [Acidobacteriota bacterium]
MKRFNNLTAGQLLSAMLACLLAMPQAPLLAGTRKGDKLRTQARNEELAGKYDHALELSEQALALDPGDPSYG